MAAFFGCVVVATVVMIAVFHHERVVMGAVQDAVDQIVAQLGKAKEEIVKAIEDAEAENNVDLSALKDAAQALDDVVPDAVPEVEEPPVEEV